MLLSNVLNNISGQVEIIQNCDTTLYYGEADADKILSDVGDHFVTQAESFLDEDGEYFFMIYVNKPTLNSF